MAVLPFPGHDKPVGNDVDTRLHVHSDPGAASVSDISIARARRGAQIRSVLDELENVVKGLAQTKYQSVLQDPEEVRRQLIEEKNRLEAILTELGWRPTELE